MCACSHSEWHGFLFGADFSTNKNGQPSDIAYSSSTRFHSEWGLTNCRWQTESGLIPGIERIRISGLYCSIEPSIRLSYCCSKPITYASAKFPMAAGWNKANGHDEHVTCNYQRPPTSGTHRNSIPNPSPENRIWVVIAAEQRTAHQWCRFSPHTFHYWSILYVTPHPKWPYNASQAECTQMGIDQPFRSSYAHKLQHNTSKRWHWRTKCGQAVTLLSVYAKGVAPLGVFWIFHFGILFGALQFTFGSGNKRFGARRSADIQNTQTSKDQMNIVVVVVPFNHHDDDDDEGTILASLIKPFASFRWMCSAVHMRNWNRYRHRMSGRAGTWYVRMRMSGCICVRKMWATGRGTWWWLDGCAKL